MKHLPRQRAFALVLVLIVIVLAATMAVFFLASAGQERRGVDLYGRGSQARHLSGMAVSRVMGQIGAATKEGSASNPVAWASQPGMIRTYGNDGKPKSIYKLYSWDSELLKAGAGYNPFAGSEVPPAGWKNQPQMYTDLNQAINGVYPIVDPGALNVVEGFSIDSSNAAVAGSGSQAPMPVKWLYVLEDGQMVAGSGASGSTVTVAGASPTNPIVGRVAFWTDDETSKVNVNTASEGEFWDTPKSATRDEMQFAANPPVRYEFQRTPGHPAMTSLSAVFPELMTGTRWGSTSTYRQDLRRLYTLTPRVSGGAIGGSGDGGSEGGTLPVTSYTTDYSLSVLPTIPSKISLDSDRLYATVDDFWFQPDRSAQSAFTSASSPVSVSSFEKRQFFLTASSRAPETTLFETPRVSLWPITWPWPSSYFRQLKNFSTFRGRNSGTLPPSVDPASPIDQNPWMTAEERLLAFCATLNATSNSPLRYYFQRQNPDSPSHDWANIQRNQQLVNYLRTTFDRDIPGFGGNLASHWGSGAGDTIALGTFDFSRSMINQVTMASTAATTVTPGVNEVGYSFTGLAARDIWINGTRRQLYAEPNAYTVAPLHATVNGSTYTTQGSYPRLTGVSVLFYATARRLPVPPAPTPPARATGGNPENDYYNPFNWQYLINAGTAYGGSGDYPVGSQTTQMRAVMLFNFAGLASGAVPAAPFFWIKVKGESFKVNGSAINLPSATGRQVQWSAWLPNAIMNPLFYPLFDKERNTPKVFENTSSAAGYWSLVSDPITVSPDSLQFTFSGEPVTVEIYAPFSDNLETDPTGTASQLVSSQVIDFAQWSQTLPVPIAPRWNVRDEGSSPSTLRPDPRVTNFQTPETRSMSWAFTEIAPNITNPTLPISPEQMRDTTVAMNTRTIPYAYMGSTGLVSPIFENRVKALSGRNAGVFFAENTSTSLDNTTVDAPTLEGVPLITPFDTVISMVADPAGAGNGDPRLGSSVAFKRIDQVLSGYQPDLVFRTSPATPKGPAYPRATARAQWHQLGTPGAAGPMSTGYRQNQLTWAGSSPALMAQTGRSGFLPGQLGASGTPPTIESVVGGIFTATGQVNPNWDWTMMPGNRMDGGMLARPDQDYQTLFLDFSDKAFIGTPYFLRYSAYGSSGSNYFSPNRQVPSPVILGTLPSSLTTGWQTLAFSPNPAAGSGHPGLSSPPDHLLLDLFWMPVAEPYPISDQFSTAGKVNLNYQIAPFSYIVRKTALHALLKSTWLPALPESAATDYKSHTNIRGAVTKSRYPLNISETLKDFDTKFSSGDVFRSASQLCEMYLVPEGETLASTKTNFWNSKRFTADNLREQPYDHLYSRVTTKSNTFTVHWRVQSLRKSPASAATVWDESKDHVAAELRGSTLIERYIDPNATNIPDYATSASAQPLGNFYRCRVVSETFFQP
ncbi:MAG: hypothetical protein BGO12_03475 [Verrucomicrobia bacterium 61-8]|nr:MAG: hypothetical protein BGO12_03475 [Verrucomicrobia bacterium 61-8]